jgi:hypothetical protein
VTPIYHITHVANLPAILGEDGLVCDAEAELRGLCQQSIAYDTIKERRKRRAVETLTGQPVAAGGVVAIMFRSTSATAHLCWARFTKAASPVTRVVSGMLFTLLPMRKPPRLPRSIGASPTATPLKP